MCIYCGTLCLEASCPCFSEMAEGALDLHHPTAGGPYYNLVFCAVSRQSLARLIAAVSESTKSKFAAETSIFLTPVYYCALLNFDLIGPDSEHY